MQGVEGSHSGSGGIDGGGSGSGVATDELRLELVEPWWILTDRGVASPHKHCVSVIQGEQPILATRSPLCSLKAVLDLPPRRFRRFHLRSAIPPPLRREFAKTAKCGNS